MTRRNFIGSLCAAGAWFMILPPATGARVWRAARPLPCLMQTSIDVENFIVEETFRYMALIWDRSMINGEIVLQIQNKRVIFGLNNESA